MVEWFCKTKSASADGVVHQVGVEYVGMKVLGGLTAVIHKDELQPKFDHSLAVRFIYTPMQCSREFSFLHKCSMCSEAECIMLLRSRVQPV